MHKENHAQKTGDIAAPPHIERRTSERFELNIDIQYQTDGMETYEPGILHNLSVDGALISVQRALESNTHIELIVPPNKIETKPTHIVATVWRDASDEIDSEFEFSYGCSVDLYLDFRESF